MLTLTDATFEQEVLKAKGPVIVDCWAPWCGPCRLLAPVMDEVAKGLEGKAKVYSLNIDENPEVPSTHGVLSIPTLLLFKDGKHKDTKVGLQTKENVMAWVEEE